MVGLSYQGPEPRAEGLLGPGVPSVQVPPGWLHGEGRAVERALRGPREHPGDLLRSWHPGRQGLVGWLPQACGVAVKEKSGLEDSSIVSAC